MLLSLRLLPSSDTTAVAAVFLIAAVKVVNVSVILRDIDNMTRPRQGERDIYIYIYTVFYD